MPLAFGFGCADWLIPPATADAHEQTEGELLHAHRSPLLPSHCQIPLETQSHQPKDPWKPRVLLPKSLIQLTWK